MTELVHESCPAEPHISGLGVDFGVDMVFVLVLLLVFDVCVRLLSVATLVLVG